MSCVLTSCAAGYESCEKKKKSKLDKSVMIKNNFWQVYFIKRPLFGAACEWTTMQHVEAPLMIKVMVMFFIEWYNNENEQLLIYTHWYKLTIEIKIKKRQTIFFFYLFSGCECSHFSQTIIKCTYFMTFVTKHVIWKTFRVLWCF